MISSEKHNPANRIIAALLVIPCLFFTSQAYHWGKADRYSYEAKQIEKQWKKDDVSRESIAAAVAKADKAVAWAPDNPVYRDQLARLLTMQYLLDRQTSVADAAMKHLLHSRSLRPNSPNNWAAYIELKHHLGAADKELADAIINAVAAGPWEPRVLQAVSRAGIMHFNALSEPAKIATIDNIRRGLTSRVSQMPSQTARLIERGAEGWTVPFIQHLSNLLVNEPWEPLAQSAKTEVSLLLWPLLEKDQRDILTIKIARALEAQRTNVLLRKVRKSGQLALVCLHLPRVARFKRPCARSNTVNLAPS